MSPFETALIAEVRRIRARLALHDGLKNFHFEIDAHGRVHDGEILIDFSLRETFGTSVQGGTGIDAVVDEFLRRNGWDKTNASLCLPNVEPAPDAEVAIDTNAPGKYEDISQ